MDFKETIDISKNWFKTGKENEDLVYRFIAYWIAFNAIYCAHFSLYNQSKDEYNKKWPKEAVLIDYLIDRIFEEKLEGCIDFDNAPECEIFKENPVFGGISPPRHDIEHYLNYKGKDNCILNYQTFMTSKDEKERLKALLKTIKQVRNNLFHGQKTPNPGRNFKLVDSSQKILKVVLEALLEGKS